MSTDNQHKLRFSRGENATTGNRHEQLPDCKQDADPTDPTDCTDPDTTEQAALLILLEHSNNPAEICREIEDCGSALALLYRGSSGSGSMTGSIPGQQSLLPCASWNDRIDETQAIISNWRELGIGFAAFFDDEYPPQLLAIRECPPFITWHGTIETNDAKGIAIIGTRRPSRSGLSTARSLAYQLSRKGVTVISGLAEGIDSAAHRGALEAGGRSVGVIGTGLLHAYPPSNAELHSEIAATGAVISQFLPYTPPAKKNFPARNAIMSGYAGATLVVEASWRSGARLQARLATQHGRPLFFTKQMLNEDWVHQYIRLPSVHVIENADDVIAALGRYRIDGNTLEWEAGDND